MGKDTELTMTATLLPCPFCGGPVRLEKEHVNNDRILGRRQWWGVTCRNTKNLGMTCCMEQVPSASPEAAIARWNMRDGVHAAKAPGGNNER